jgi:hypothetical protein
LSAKENSRATTLFFPYPRESRPWTSRNGSRPSCRTIRSRGERGCTCANPRRAATRGTVMLVRARVCVRVDLASLRLLPLCLLANWLLATGPVLLAPALRRSAARAFRRLLHSVCDLISLACCLLLPCPHVSVSSLYPVLPCPARFPVRISAQRSSLCRYRTR